MVTRGRCTFLCKNFEVKKGTSKTSLYENGYRYCASCEKFMLTDSRFCECCGQFVRQKARKRLYRKDPVKYIE